MQPVYIVKNMKNNSLGNPAIKAFKLLLNVESFDKKVVLHYLLLFNGLDTFAHEYKIKLNPVASYSYIVMVTLLMLSALQADEFSVATFGH